MSVESGVTGKERTFQQNRAFGPGAMKPYVNEMAERRLANGQRGYQRESSYRGRNSGVYRGAPNRAGRSENPGLKGHSNLGPGRLI